MNKAEKIVRQNDGFRIQKSRAFAIHTAHIFSAVNDRFIICRSFVTKGRKFISIPLAIHFLLEKIEKGRTGGRSFVSVFCILYLEKMTIITEVIVVALLISLILASLRKTYDWMFSTRSKLPSPPAYPILRHLPYFWNAVNDVKMLRLWGECFKAEGIFEFDVLLGNVWKIFGRIGVDIVPQNTIQACNTCGNFCKFLASKAQDTCILKKQWL